MSDAALCEPRALSSPIRAGELRPGMVVRYDDRIFRVLLADRILGTDRTETVFVRLRALAGDTLREDNLHPDAAVEVLSVQRRSVRFNHATPGGFLFSDPTGSDLRVTADEIGPKGEFLVPGMPVFIDTVEGRFSGLDFPDLVEVEVVDTQTVHNADEENLEKPATLANGFRVMVPLHVRKGDKVLLHFPTLRYVDASAASRRQDSLRPKLDQD